MAPARPLSVFAPKWGSDAIALAEQAKVLSGTKLAQLVRRLQRQTGRTQEKCWRFVIKYGIKAEFDHRRWSEEELDEARELLTKYSVEDVAKRLNRSAKALRNALQRRQLSVREIRCNCFSLESLAQVLHVRRSEIVSWIEQGWLQATITKQAHRASWAGIDKLCIETHRSCQVTSCSAAVFASIDGAMSGRQMCSPLVYIRTQSNP
jgi:hypothetical protein